MGGKRSLLAVRLRAERLGYAVGGTVSALRRRPSGSDRRCRVNARRSDTGSGATYPEKRTVPGRIEVSPW